MNRFPSRDDSGEDATSPVLDMRQSVEEVHVLPWWGTPISLIWTHWTQCLVTFHSFWKGTFFRKVHWLWKTIQECVKRLCHLYMYFHLTLSDDNPHTQGSTSFGTSQNQCFFWFTFFSLSGNHTTWNRIGTEARWVIEGYEGQMFWSCSSLMTWRSKYILDSVWKP